jgi:hypothetical protein
MISKNIFVHKFDLIWINNLLRNKYSFNNNVQTIDEQYKLLFKLKFSYQNLTKTFIFQIFVHFCYIVPIICKTLKMWLYNVFSMF